MRNLLLLTNIHSDISSLLYVHLSTKKKKSSCPKIFEKSLKTIYQSTKIKKSWIQLSDRNDSL